MRWRPADLQVLFFCYLIKYTIVQGITQWWTLILNLKPSFHLDFLSFVARFGFSYQQKATTSNAMLKWKHPQKTKTSNKKP